MKNREKIGVTILIMILVSTVFLFGGIEKQTVHRAAEAALAKTEITITDYRGRNVTLPYPVERIVLLQHHAAWAIRLLGVEDKVVGVSKHLSEAGMYPKLSSKPVCGTWQHPNYEEIAQLRPQVVITFHPNPGPGVVEEAARKLEPFGIRIVALRFTQMRTSQFEILAKILGKEEKAKEFLGWRESKLNLVKEGLRGLEEKVRVYNEPDFRGPYVTRPERSIDFAGGNNIANEILPPEAMEKSMEKEVSAEWILKKNPEVVIIGDWPPRVTGYRVKNYTKAMEQIKEFTQRPGMEKISAVRNSRVYVMDYELSAGATSWIGALYLAKILYPQRFKDLNPGQIHKQFFEKWLRIDYQGTYICPHPWAK